MNQIDFSRGDLYLTDTYSVAVSSDRFDDAAIDDDDQEFYHNNHKSDQALGGKLKSRPKDEKQESWKKP
jgi:hypothetical protein